LAAIRGETRDEDLFRQAAALAHARGIDIESDLEPLFDRPAADGDADAVKRLRQVYEAGGWVLLESALADLPIDLRRLYESDAVTLEELAHLHRSRDIVTVADLAAALDADSSEQSPLPPETGDAIAAVLPNLRATVPRISLGRAVAIAEPFLSTLCSAPGVAWAEALGSLRRGEDTIGDIELMAAASDPGGAMERLLAHGDASRCLHRSERRLYFFVGRVQVGIRLPEPSNAGASLLYLTGSREHFGQLQDEAATRGYRLTPRGLYESGGRLIAADRDEDIYTALGLPPIPPEIRNGDEEVRAAGRGELPALLTRRDIRGDLHMHSLWSDGRDTIEAMVGACRALGYEYVAITDHSPSSAASRNLTLDGVATQADEIAALRERYPEMAILHGCEADILPDGGIDFPDRVLQRFDIVLASLHESAGQGRDQLMNRYIAAMRHPLVSIITHPTNRLVPTRAGYDLDYERLFGIAAETRTLVEIDGAPGHLDLDGTLARRAVSAGAMLVVNSDCHRAELLERHMKLGVLMARRGWVEPRHVVNTQPLANVLSHIARKRAGG
jgi:DNA polymerase (family X)